MSPDLERPAKCADQAVDNDYDSFAEAYAAESESNLHNGYYARPAILDLAGDVTGRRILDVGCGAGSVLEALRDRGAIVTGVEPSAKMLELARQRLGEGADLHQAGLGGDPLPFPDDAFDDAVACLVLHYLEDWKTSLAELRRVLAPGGRLIVAVNHPFVYKLQHPDADYFATSKWSEEYILSGQSATLTYWHRPLHAMTSAFTEAGFQIAVVREPPPHQAPASVSPKCLPRSLKTLQAQPSCASCSSSWRPSSLSSSRCRYLCDGGRLVLLWNCHRSRMLSCTEHFGRIADT